VFHPVIRWLVINQNRSILRWEIGDPVASARQSDRLGRMGVFSRYEVAAGLTRNWGYYAWKLGVPLRLIVLIALVL
jgi:hypothetical protein